MTKKPSQPRKVKRRDRNAARAMKEGATTLCPSCGKPWVPQFHICRP